AAALQNAKENKNAPADDEDIDPTQYLENRLKYLATEKRKGKNPYPHKFSVTLSIEQYIKEYGSLNDGQHLDDVSVSLAG
ncbi:lysine-tRNA ligase, partial [Trifolium medium]|nr:lysine-tRNA ligase [Trifolium medium]